MLTSQSIDPNDPNSQRWFFIRWIVNAWQWLVPPTQAHKDRESSASHTLRMGLGIGLCLTLVVLSLLYARPGYDRYKQYRSDGYLDEAERYAKANDFASALINAGRAHTSTPSYERSLRLNAELYTKASLPQATFFWGQLERAGSTTTDDRMGHIRALLRTNRQSEAKERLDQVIEESPMSSAVAGLAEEVMGTKAATSALLGSLKKLVTDSAEPETALRLARIQIQSENSEEIGLGIASLWLLSERTDKVGLESLRLLRSSPEIDIAGRRKVVDRTQGHPLVEGSDHCQILSLQIELDPGYRPQYIDKVQGYFKDKRGDDVAPFIYWCQQNKEHSRIFLLVTEADVRRWDSLRAPYLNSLANLGRMNDLDRLVSDQAFILPRGRRAFYHAIIALARRMPKDTIHEKLREVLTASIRDADQDLLLRLASFCLDELKDFHDIANDCYVHVSKSGKQRLERVSFDGWIRCAIASGDTASLLKAAGDANTRWPDDKVFMEESLYAKFLIGNEIELSLAMAERLMALSPSDPKRKLVCALGYYRLGDLQTAVNALQGIDLTSVRVGQQAVFACILREAGPLLTTDGNEADFQRALESVLRVIPPDARLLPEEAQLLQIGSRKL
jgi:hypothetical protein